MIRAWAAMTFVACAATARPQVALLEEGDSVVLSNRLLTATLSKSKASVTSLRLRGVEMLRAGYYSMDGGKDFRVPAGCRFFIKTQTPDVVDVGMRRVWRDEPQAFDMEIHYVLRRGDSGLYSYAILEHPASYPETRVGEWRFVWKLPPDLLERICVDDLRNWRMQHSRDRFENTPIAEIIKLTSGIRAGQYDCKYDFNANYHDLGCWGHVSDTNKLGAWIVLGSHEFFNDGPTKQDLTAAYGINHLHFGMNHYNGSVISVKAGQAWRKMFGPFLLYCNNGSWADAQARARLDRQAWPHAWLTGNPEYPLAPQRGTLAGTLVVRDPLKPQHTGAGAWVGLAQMENGQFDSMHYQYWARADANGSFLIPHVRPGTYTLFAFTTGAVGEFARADVRVEAGKTNQAGDLVWNVPRKGARLAWEIGIPDRTAKEFRHGNNYFHGYLWERIPKEFPNPLTYIVGQSHWSNDWNYAQTRYVEADGNITPHTWRIQFELPAAPRGDATLTLAIASADHARLRVFVNSENRTFTTVTPRVQGGNALLREGIHAKYCVESVTIPAGLLKAGREHSRFVTQCRASNGAAQASFASSCQRWAL